CQQRRMPAAGRSEHDETVGREDLKIDAIGRGDQVVPGLVLQRNTPDVEDRRRSLCHDSSSAPGALYAGSDRQPAAPQICHGSRSRSTLPPLKMMPTAASCTSSKLSN